MPRTPRTSRTKATNELDQIIRRMKERERHELYRRFNALTPATRRMFVALCDAGGEQGVTAAQLCEALDKRQLAPYDREKLERLRKIGFVTIERRALPFTVHIGKDGTRLRYGAAFEYVYTVPPGLIEKPEQPKPRGLLSRLIGKSSGG